MERIKQALEKAREDRLRNGLSSGTGGLQPTVTPVTQIIYSQTRTQQVQKHILREQRILVGQNTTASASAYGILRTQVLQRLGEHGWNALRTSIDGWRDDDNSRLVARQMAIEAADRHLRSGTDVVIPQYLGSGDADPGIYLDMGIRHIIGLTQGPDWGLDGLKDLLAWRKALTSR